MLCVCVCVVISLMTNLTRRFSLYLSYSSIITMATHLNAHWRVESRQSCIHPSLRGLRRLEWTVMSLKGFCMEAEWNARTPPSLIVILEIKAIGIV